MTPLTEALLFAGIVPPPEGSNRTTCPMCSHTRRKADDRCLSIYPRDGWVDWKCHHCGWQDGDIVQ